MDATSLSTPVIQRIILDTLMLIPSIAPPATIPSDMFQSVASPVSFVENSSCGSIVNRVGSRLSADTDGSLDSVSSAIDSDDTVQDDVHDITVQLAQVTANVYGMLRANISKQADDLVTKITDRLSALDSRSPDQVAQEDHITFVNWGALSDPSVVLAVTNACYNEAKAFVPGQEIQKYYIDGCLAAASRYAPAPVSGSENQAALARSLEDLAGNTDGAIAPNTYVATNNSIYLGLLTEVKNKIYSGGAALVSAIDRVTSLYQDVQKYQSALAAPDANVSGTLSTNTSQLVIGVALLLGALQAARQSIYNETLYFGNAEDGSILVNSDTVSEFESKGYTSANLVTVYRYLTSQGFSVTTRGLSIGSALQKADVAISTEAANLADLAERADIETQQLFQKTITAVVGDWVNGYTASVGTSVSQNDIAQRLTQLPISAVKSDTPLGDLIMDFILFVYNTPALTAMDGYLRANIGGDQICNDLDVSSGRTLALGQFIYWLITQPRYISA